MTIDLRLLSLGAVTLLAVLSAHVRSQEPASSVVRSGATLEKLAGDFRFTEGPAADAEGSVYFTDQPNDRILKWSTDGQLTTFLQPCGRSNGLYFDASGHLLACADEQNELWSIAPDGTHTVLVGKYEGHRLNGPNDLWVHPSGDIYFTDPYYQRPYWKHQQPELDQKGVYRLSADRQTLQRVATDFKQPNGLIGSPDGKTLFVSDISDSKTYAFTIADDGSLTDRRLFCSLGSDGMTIDEESNVYLTGKGVIVFNAKGEKRETIDVPESWTANVTFGGPDRRTLFITASQGLYSIAMRVTGAPTVVQQASEQSR